MLGAILQASFSEFLNEIEPGTWIPLGVFVLGVTYQSPIENDSRFTATQNRFLRTQQCTKSKGRKQESIGRVLKKLILVNSS